MNYTVLNTDAEATAYARVLAHSFGRPESESAAWVGRHDRGNIRVLADSAGVQAGLILLPMGQFFGGRSVPMWGVAAVGVAPEARGRGVATELMRRALAEMHGHAVPISTLYPAIQRLYRAVGYEQAGHRYEVRLPLHRVGRRSHEPSSAGARVRPMVDADRAPVQALYRFVSRNFDGNLDRSAVIWDRIERPPPTRTEPARAFVVEDEAGTMQGYVFLSQHLPAIPIGGRHEVQVHDMACTTGTAGRALWSFLAGYATMAPEMTWCCGPCHHLLMMLPEQIYRPTLKDHWMVRITNVRAALAARGYGAPVRGSLRLEVHDAVIAPNNGAYTLRVEGGEAEVTAEKGSDTGRAPGTIRLGITALAGLYTGFVSPWALRAIGELEGDDDAVGVAAAIFAGSTPWMTDHF